MLVEVVAIPLAASPIRIGARFTLKEGVPLRIGPSAQARIRLSSSPQAKDLIVEPGLLRVEGAPMAASLNGVTIERDARLEVGQGDHLFIDGLVIRFGQRPIDPRDAGLEKAIANEPNSDAAWSVYADFLLEQNQTVPRARDLGPLADAHRSAALTTEWNTHGTLKRAQLLRAAIIGSPGLFWHLEQLAKLRSARFLEQLDIDYFVGTAPAHVDRPHAYIDQTLSEALTLLSTAGFAASLRSLSLGHVANSPLLDLTRQTFERYRSQWPNLQGDFRTLVHDGVRARLELLTTPQEVSVIGLCVGDTWQVPPHSTLGSASSAQLRILGANIAGEIAVILRSREGGWSIAAIGVDDMSSRASSSLKLNGTAATRAVLHANDLIEVVPGLTFRFKPE